MNTAIHAGARKRRCDLPGCRKKDLQSSEGRTAGLYGSRTACLLSADYYS